MPRTTNGVESWHRILNNRCEIAHPNIGKFITIIQKEEELTRFKMTQCINGNLETLQKNYQWEEKIRLIADNFDMFTEESYFKALDRVYQWNFENE